MARRPPLRNPMGPVMGMSVRMIERHYGALLDGAHAGIAGRLDALDAQFEQAVGEAGLQGRSPAPVFGNVP